VASHDGPGGLEQADELLALGSVTSRLPHSTSPRRRGPNRRKHAPRPGLVVDETSALLAATEELEDRLEGVPSALVAA